MNITSITISTGDKSDAHITMPCHMAGCESDLTFGVVLAGPEPHVGILGWYVDDIWIISAPCGHLHEKMVYRSYDRLSEEDQNLVQDLPLQPWDAPIHPYARYLTEHATDILAAEEEYANGPDYRGIS